MSLRVAQIVESTEAEGPGLRFALWVQGCTLRCPGCCNPEMFGSSGGRVVETQALVDQLMAVQNIEGLSVLGGEPFEQAEGVAELCEAVHATGRSVMVYSGFTLAELHAKNDARVDRLLRSIDVLVDGRFEKDQPETARRWLGSANQHVHFLTERGRRDEPRFSGTNTVELRLSADGLSVNGWPALADALRGQSRR